MTVEATAVQAEAPAQSNQKVKGRWGSLLAIGFSMILDNNEGASIITNLFPVIREALGISIASLGVIAAVPRIVGVIFGPFWAYMARRYNRKTILVFVTGVWGLWAITIGFSQNLWQLILFLVISVIGASAGQPIVQEVMTDLFGDEERGKATAIVFGGSGVFIIFLFPVFGWLSTIPDGWRYGFYGAGVLSALSGLLIWAVVKDPGRAAAEQELADIDQERRESYGVLSWDEVKELFKVKTFVLMLGQRLLSGHLLMLSFGVVYIVDVLGYDTQQANLMMMPLFIGMLTGIFAGGFAADIIHKRYPNYGRIAIIQVIQGVYAVAAFFGTQLIWGTQVAYIVLFFIMGFFGSANAGVNRPVIAAVVRPELRGTAFALFVSVFEAIGWAFYTIIVGQISEAIGLKLAFGIFLVGLMAVNTLYITLIYKPYAQDQKALHQQLAARRTKLVEAS